MPRLSEQTVCQAIGKMANRADYDASTFCLHCPDIDKIPQECDLSCGWPTHISFDRQRRCKYVKRCPCAQPGSEERIRKMEEWQRGHKQRATAGVSLWQDNAGE